MKLNITALILVSAVLILAGDRLNRINKASEKIIKESVRDRLTYSYGEKGNHLFYQCSIDGRLDPSTNLWHIGIETLDGTENFWPTNIVVNLSSDEITVRRK